MILARPLIPSHDPTAAENVISFRAGSDPTPQDDDLCACCRLTELAVLLRDELAGGQLLVDREIVAHAHAQVWLALDTLTRERR